MARNVPRRPSRRTVLGAGAGLSALGLVSLGSVPGLSGEAWADAERTGERATDPGSYISFTPRAGAFPLVAGGQGGADRGQRGRPPRRGPGRGRPAGRHRSGSPACGPLSRRNAGRARTAEEIMLVGTIGQSPLIDDLVAAASSTSPASRASGRPRCSRSSSNPLPGVRPRVRDRRQRPARHDLRRVRRLEADRRLALVLVGRRARRASATRSTCCPAGTRQGTPAVKYRGLLHQRREPGPRHLGARATSAPARRQAIPAASTPTFFARVFEAMLRLKANYLWPAVWGRAFAEDDPLNHATAKAYGVVMGTSHEAPMMRGIEEWNRHAVRRGARRGRQHRHAGPRPVRRHRRVELPPQRRRASRRTGATASERMADAGLRGRRHARHARQRRRQPARRRRHRADAGDHRHRSGRSSPTSRARTSTTSRRCGPSTRRSSATGTRGCARPTTSPSSSPTTTGATCASCPTREPAAAQRRLRPVLPLRLRRRRPQLQVGRHHQRSQHVGAAQPGRTPTASTGCGWSTSAT